MDPSKVFSSAGTIIAISASLPASYDVTGFLAINGTFQTIGEISDAGEWGRVYEVITWQSLDRRGTVKRKGSYNDGTMNLQLGRVPTDGGQALLAQYLNLDDSCSLRITLQDGTVQYFTAQVMSYTTNVGSLNQITSAACALEIDNDLLEIVFDSFTVNFVAGANGEIIGDTTQEVASGGNSAPVYASAADLYEFVEWSDSNTDNPRIVTNVTANATLTATFALI